MKVQAIPLDQISQDKNTRGDYRDSSIDEIMTSMRQHGLLQPIALFVKKDGKYTVVFGNRRVIAAKKLGWKEIDAAILGEAGNKEADIDFIIKNASENMQRKDPTFLEQGRLFHELIVRFKLNVKEITARIGVPEKRVRDILEAYERVPTYLRSEIVLNKIGHSADEKLSLTNANAVVSTMKSYGLPEGAKEKLFKMAMQPNVTPSKINQIGKLMHAGISFGAAKKYLGSVKVISVNFMLVEESIAQLEKHHGKPIKKIIYDFVKESGKFPFAKVADEISQRKKQKEEYQNVGSF